MKFLKSKKFWKKFTIALIIDIIIGADSKYLELTS